MFLAVVPAYLGNVTAWMRPRCGAAGRRWWAVRGPAGRRGGGGFRCWRVGVWLLVAGGLGHRGEAGAADAQLRLTRLVGGELRLQLQGEPGRSYGFEASPDLRRWTNWVVRVADAAGAAEAGVGAGTPGLFFRVAATASPGPADPAEVALGERLFLETRFAQFFAAHSAGDPNRPLAAGDPVMELTVTTAGAVPGPFRGQSMNCRACHLVDEHTEALGNRTYADFAARSPIPDRGDGRFFTPRNSPTLVGASAPRPVPLFLHWDGEFPDGPSLVAGTWTGRNFGWLPTEGAAARQHIGRVIREDTGRDDLGSRSGGAYRTVLAGLDPSIPVELRLPAEYRIEVMGATDEAILAALSRLVNAYLEGLVLATDAEGQHIGSPYDVFLAKNGLPRQPAPGESDVAYGARLLSNLVARTSFQFVTLADGGFTTHDQDFVFGDAELAGLKMFLSRPGPEGPNPRTGLVGNCVMCHAPPRFTDFRFHNTGVTQREYDGVHGFGTFGQLPIPSLSERQATPEAFLPPTANHPFGTGRYAQPASTSAPGQADLGVWNVFANPDVPAVQPALRALLGGGEAAADAAVLPGLIASFKTPGLRDLEHSNPYFHTGDAATLTDTVEFYRMFSELARAGLVRNADPELARIALRQEDIDALVRFLRSLNEDYE